MRHRVRRARGRAGGREVRKASSGEHAAIAEERAVLCAMLPCCPDSLARHDHRGCGQALGVPPHSTAQAAACRFVKESGAGVAGAGCDGAARVADAVSAAPPSGKWWWGRAVAAHPRRSTLSRRGAGYVRPQYGVVGYSMIYDGLQLPTS